MAVFPLPTYALGPIYRFTVGGQEGVEGRPSLPPAPWGQGRGPLLVARSFLSLGGLGGESWSARVWAARLAAGFGAGSQQAGSGRHSSRPWEEAVQPQEGPQTSGGEGAGGNCQGSRHTTRPACLPCTNRAQPPAWGLGDQTKPQGVLAGPAQETAPETLINETFQGPGLWPKRPLPFGTLWGAPQQVVLALPAACMTGATFCGTRLGHWPDLARAGSQWSGSSFHRAQNKS